MLNHSVFAGSDVYMLSSTVSSKILQTMAGMEGFQFEVSKPGQNSVACFKHKKAKIVWNRIQTVKKG